MEEGNEDEDDDEGDGDNGFIAGKVSCTSAPVFGTEAADDDEGGGTACILAETGTVDSLKNPSSS